MARGEDTGSHAGRQVPRPEFPGDPRAIPPKFGTTPIPEGTVRFNHYTWGRNVEGIRESGLQRSYSEEKFAHGGTESPQVFANAGEPGEMPNRGDKHFVEAYAKADQLDIGAPYGASRLSTDQLGAHMKDLESRRSTITMHGDIPKEQIVAIHEPWHQTHEYLNKNPDMEANIVAGNYNGVEPELDTAMVGHKIGAAAKVMLGGKLQGKAY